MKKSTGRAVLREIAFVVAGFYAVAGVDVALELGALGTGSFSRPLAAFGLFASAALIVGGVRKAGQSPRLGWTLAAVGLVIPASQMTWAAFTPIPWILLAVFLVVRAVNVVRQRQAHV